MKLKIFVFMVFIAAVVGGYKYYLYTREVSNPIEFVKPEITSKPMDKIVVPTLSPIPSVTAESEKDLSIVTVGDILLGRGVGQRLNEQRRSFVYPFEKVAGLLKEGDVVFGNLEEPITSSTHGLLGISEGGKYVLKNEVAAFSGIQYAGFNLLSLANNHILDYYDKGLFDTQEILSENGITFAGAGKNLREARRAAIIERNGVKVGMLAYTDMSEVMYKGDPPLMFIAENDKAGVAPRYTDVKYIIEDIVKVRDEVDILMVSLHWGVEESFDVLTSQRDFAKDLLDAGADMIVGHHPHQFQGIEIYDGKPIFYSLGNFIFDQNDPENQQTFIVNMKYSKNRLKDICLTPVRTENKIQIVPLNGEDAKPVMHRQVELCEELGTRVEISGGKLVITQ